MNILTIGASNHRQSINRALAIHAAEVFKTNHQPTAEIEVVDLNDYELPIYSLDREQVGGVPDLAKQLFAKIGATDALIISYAEYNGTYTSAWKNIFDWMSRIDSKVFQNKPMLVLATSPGGRGASSVLAQAVQSAPHFAAEVKASLSVPSFGQNFDLDKGSLSNPELKQQLDTALDQLNS